MIARLSKYIENCKRKNGTTEKVDFSRLDLRQPLIDQLPKKSKYSQSPWLNFSSRQIETARSEFAGEMTHSEQVILFQDCSFLQNGSIGLIVTNEAIYTSYLSVSRIPLARIRNYSAKCTDHVILTVGVAPQLYINGECAMYSCQDYELFHKIMTLLI